MLLNGLIGRARPCAGSIVAIGREGNGTDRYYGGGPSPEFWPPSNKKKSLSHFQRWGIIDSVMSQKLRHDGSGGKISTNNGSLSKRVCSQRKNIIDYII